MEFTHKKYDKVEIADITQKQLEIFQVEMKKDRVDSLAVWRGDIVRAAINAGFFVFPIMTADEIDGMNPRKVSWLEHCVTRVVTEALSDDPLV